MIDGTTGKGIQASGEHHRCHALLQPDLEAFGAVAQQHHRGSRASRRPGRSRADRSADLDDELDLDRGVQRQRRDADRAARVHPGVAEDFAEQLAGAVDHARLAGESGVLATKPTTFTTRRLRQVADPARTAASAFSAQIRASSFAARASTSAPTLPVAAMAPSTIGS